VLLFLGWPRPRDIAAPRRAARLATVLAIAAPLLLAAHAAAWLVTVSPEHTLTADGVAAAVAGGAGRVELWRTALALLALWALVLARRPRLALAFAVGALVASGGSGHPAAIDPRWAEPAKAAHLLAGAAWLGGVLWLLAVRGSPRDPADGEAFAVEALRVSSVALAAALLVALSGAVQALLFLASPLDLVRSTYGAITLAKVTGTLALVAFGAYHRLRILPRVADAAVAGRFTRMLRAELAVMAVVVLLGGLLAYVPPPSAPTLAADALSHASVPDHTP
jgi:putative copper export protein